MLAHVAQGAERVTGDGIPETHRAGVARETIPAARVNRSCIRRYKNTIHVAAMSAKNPRVERLNIPESNSVAVTIHQSVAVGKKAGTIAIGLEYAEGNARACVPQTQGPVTAA